MAPSLKVITNLPEGEIKRWVELNGTIQFCHFLKAFHFKNENQSDNEINFQIGK